MFVSQLLDSFIAKDLLRLMAEKPHIYSCDTRQGLSALKKEALSLSIKYIHSFKGIYHQAKLTGICIGSHWWHEHNSITDETTALQDLLLLASRVSSTDFHVLDLNDKGLRQTIQICLVKGFENGIRLGQKIAQIHEPTNTPITTASLHALLIQLSPRQQKTTQMAPQRITKQLGRQIRIRRLKNTRQITKC